MRQEAFVRTREERWRAFESELAALEGSGTASAGFPGAYRVLCQDVALARDRGFATGLVTRLEALALRGHQALYGARPWSARSLLETLLAFPIALRREWRLLLACSVLFYGTGVAAFAMVRADPDAAFTLVGRDQALVIEQMYDPEAEHMGAPRDTTSDLAAFGYYVRNNVGIGFRCFASGILFGIGSVLLLLFNGIVLGGVAGHIQNVGFGETFWPFVVGHGALELNAIVVCGMCGLRLGLALVAPGRRRRVDALQHAARAALPLLYGGTAMLLGAAVIEAFWSSQHDLFSNALFYGVGAALWLGVFAALLLGGRRLGD